MNPVSIVILKFVVDATSILLNEKETLKIK